MKKIINNKKKLILLAGFVLGCISIIFFGDNKLDNEWGVMVGNLENYNILSSRKVNNQWVPNLFMPPLYPIFLFLIKKFFSYLSSEYLIMILFTQLFLFLFSTNNFHKILLEIFQNKNIADLGMLIFTLFPLNVYSIGQISSITLQIFLLMFFFYNFILFYKYSYKKNIIFLSIFSGLLILLRGEFFIIFIFTLFFLILKKKKLFFFVLAITITLITISPYLVRNFIIFDSVVLTKSKGFNLLKGNNPKSRVEGIGMWYGYDVVPELETELKKIQPISKYDLLSDKIFLSQAIKFIKDNPIYYIKLYFKKFFSYIFIDFESTYPNYYSIFHILPKILISLVTLISMFYCISTKLSLFNYFALIYLFNGFIFSFFFILPRYSLFILPIQIILSLFIYERYLIYKKNKNVLTK